MNTMESVKVDIIPFEERYIQDFTEINVEWLEEFFVVEEYDIQILKQAKEKIIDQGGEIFFARVDNQIVGTVAMINRDELGYELAKMGVRPAYQGRKIGQKLMDVCLDYARNKGIKRVYLESNRIMKPAINFYYKTGFTELKEYQPTPYKRSDIQMEIFL